MKAGNYDLKKLLILIMLFAVVWGGSLIRCEVLTSKHGAEFTIPDVVTAWFGDDGTAKVISYSSQAAKVYYYSIEDGFAEEIYFIKHGNAWVFDTWGTVWSSTGNADDFMWPYFYHTPTGMVSFFFISIPALLVATLLLAGIALCFDIYRRRNAEKK